MFPINMSNGMSYTIPLDCLDMRYVRKTLSRSDRPLPVWSANNDKKYYQFEILAQRKDSITEEKDLAVNDKIEIDLAPQCSTYKCSICNIDVPKLYWKLHNDSSKHKTCLDIAGVAMQRVRENMFADAPTTCPDTSSTYYCECCATAVNIQQRTEHEASKAHIDSLKLDELLFNLVNLYKDMKNNLDDVLKSVFAKNNTKMMIDTAIQTSHSVNNVINETVRADTKTNYHDNEKAILKTITSKKNNEITTNRIVQTRPVVDKVINNTVPADTGTSYDNNTSAISKNITSKKNTEIIADRTVQTAQIVDRVINETANNDYTRLKNYYDNINIRMNGRGIVTIKNEETLIIRVENCLLEVNAYNFHGLNRHNDTKVICILCLYVIKDGDMEAHFNSKKHINNITVPLEDMNCVRYDKNTSWRIHCILCNKLIYTNTIDDHFLNAEHWNAFNQALIHDPLEQNNFNDVTNKEFDVVPNVITSKANTSPVTEATVTQTNVKTNLLPPHYHVKVTQNPERVLCKVCNIVLAYDAMTIELHVACDKHIRNYNELLSMNRLKNIVGGYHCAVCIVNVSNKNELDHIKGRNHNNNAKGSIQSTNTVKDNSRIDASSKTNADLTAGNNGQPSRTFLDAINFPMIGRSLSHQDNLKQNESNIDKTTPTNSTKINLTPKTYCRPCNRYIDTHNFPSHEKGLSHQANLLQNDSDSDTSATTTTTSEANMELTYHKATLTSTILPITPKITPKTYCESCDRYIDTHNFPSHEKGLSHQANLLQNDSDSDTSDTSATTTTTSEANMELTNHKAALTSTILPITPKITPKTYCESCDRYIDTHNFSGHLKGMLHRSNLVQKGSHLDTITSKTSEANKDLTINKTDSDSKMLPSPKINVDLTPKTYCQPCNKYIDTHNFPSHQQDLYHQANLKQMESDLDSTSPNLNADTDITNSHSTSMKTDVDLTTETYCRTCGIYYGTNNSIHEKSVSHQENLKQKESDLDTTASTISTKINSTPKMYCQPCNRYIYKHNISSHERGSSHRGNLMQIESDSDSVTSAIFNENTDSINKTDASSKILSPSPKTNVDLTPKTHCLPCDRYIHTHNFASHERSKLHLKKFKLISGNSTKSDPNPKSYCEVCKTEVHTHNMNSHKKGRRHLVNVMNNIIDELKPQNVESVNKKKKPILNPCKHRGVPRSH